MTPQSSKHRVILWHVALSIRIVHLVLREVWWQRWSKRALRI